MPRVARIVAPGFPHHLTQRGNRREPVFFQDADRQKYLMLLLDYKDRYGLDIWAYCLMGNHVHLVAVPRAADSLSRTMRDTHQAYSSWLNRRLAQSGHVWQGRFYSTVLDESHAWAAVAYVERNPLRAGMAARTEEYPWSSAAARCGQRRDPLLATDWPPSGMEIDWSAWLAREEPAKQIEAIRQRTRTGRPCGELSFIERLEGILGRALKPRKVGRKPKKLAGKA